MKQYIILVLAAATLWLASCNPKTYDPVLVIGDAASISAPSSGTAYVFTDSTTEEIITFSWSSADFGFDAGISYTLEMDVEGNEFANALALATQNATEYVTTHGDINSALIAFGRPDNVVSKMQFRIVATVSPEVDPSYSAPITLDMTPFKVVVIYPKLTVPGSYQGWAPENEETAVYDRKFNNNYEGFVYMEGAGVKYKFAQGLNWNTNWGDDGGDGTLEPSGADIDAPGEGFILLEVSLDDLTYKATATSWGVIGNATPTGWDNDTDMVYDEATGKLTLTLDLIEGLIKFRANDGWDINLGDNDGNGSMEFGGADIAVPSAGNYTIELDLQVPDYAYRLTKN